MRAILLAPLLALLAGATTAQPVPSEQQRAADRVRAHVEYLADDQLEGRAAGTRGHELAAL